MCVRVFVDTVLYIQQDFLAFKQIECRSQKRVRYLQLLKSLELFHSLNELELEMVVYNLHAETVEPGGLILNQGAAGGDCMFFIEEGQVFCTKNEVLLLSAHSRSNISVVV